MSEKRSVNLCSIYMLPILGLNRWSFGNPDNYVNSYITNDDSHIVVECKSAFTPVIVQHANFKFAFTEKGNHFAVFEFPTAYLDDVKKFRQGKYSLFSENAKNLIRKKSGLTYKVPLPQGGFRSALELLALDKDKTLKKHLEEQFSNPTSPVVLDDDAELASIPDEGNFYDLKISSMLLLNE